MGSIYYDTNKVKNVYYDLNKVKKIYYDTMLVWTAEEYSTSALTLNSVDPYYATPQTSFSFALRPVTMTCSYNVVTKNNDGWLRHAYVLVHGVRSDGTLVTIGVNGNQISLPSGTGRASGNLTIQCSSPNGETFTKYQISLQTHGYQMNWGNVTNIKFTAYYRET